MKWSENMTEREKLLAILHDIPEVQTLNETADYLLKHGVTISTTEFVKRETIVEKLDSLGGCGATDDWSKGWDAAIDTAIEEIRKLPAVVQR